MERAYAPRPSGSGVGTRAHRRERARPRGGAEGRVVVRGPESACGSGSDVLRPLPNNALMRTGLSDAHGRMIVGGRSAGIRAARERASRCPYRAAVLAPSLRSGAAPPDAGHIPASSVGGVCPTSVLDAPPHNAIR